ncbi:hypothetical protein [Otoolea muris]|uniref:hypothetical protein n=1 Tax=Otoolea muris TaxID=2941515 RepID=UPI002040669B|nr:hypothetical protein [Otoolea muris]
MAEYDLMHKNKICGRLSVDEETGRVISYKDNGSGLSPFVGHADLKKIKQWWEMRHTITQPHMIPMRRWEGKWKILGSGS